MKNDFMKYAVSRGLNSMHVEKAMTKMYDGISSPYILEERQLHVQQLDIISRLQMERIIFLGSEINSESIAAVNGISSDLMRLTTGALNYSMSLLTLATKNGAKIALAAVDATGKAAAVATKNAANAAKEKAGEVKDTAKAKAQEVAGKIGKGKKER